MSPFKVYRTDPLSLLNLVPKVQEETPNVDASKRAKEIQKLRKQVETRIEKSNTSHQVQPNKHKKKMAFQLGDLVWIHLRKGHFP